MTDFHIIIPARYASTRLPGKVLMDICGKSMLHHVYERALESNPQSIMIATDHPAIQLAAEKLGASVCMTSPEHLSGSERIAEVVSKLGFSSEDIIVNLQCDEPLISPLVIRQLAEDLSGQPQGVMATLYEYIDQVEDLFDPSIVKTVLDSKGYALYFSRSPIPWIEHNQKEIPKNTYCRHVGLYAYRVSFLKQYVQWKPSPLEEIESLEQLRILWQGAKIHLTLAKESVPSGVNTLEDLERVRRVMQEKMLEQARP